VSRYILTTVAEKGTIFASNPALLVWPTSTCTGFLAEKLMRQKGKYGDLGIS
jgi:hypothetical protein